MRKLSMEELGRKSVDEFKQSDKFPIIVVLENIRSAYNVGSVFRTSDAFLIEAIYIIGYSAKPPHKEIKKTALGAEETVTWKYFKTSTEAIDETFIDDKTEQQFNLDELLGFDGSDVDTKAQLICKVEDSKVAGSIVLRVNEVTGTEQVLVRSLGSRGGRWLGVAGAAEMRDGTVALLLDLPALIETSVRSRA